MLFQRIGAHLKRQDWIAVCLDLVILVIGVFLALQVDNWNDARIAQENTNTYYARLVDDLRAEEATRLARIDYYQQVRLHGEAALRALAQDSPQREGQLLIDLYQASQRWDYTPQRATYDELLSGNISHAIPDPALRARLANYYLALENSETAQDERTPYRSNLRRYMPHAIQAEIRHRCGDKYEFLSDYVGQFTLPKECDATFEPQAILDAHDALQRYTELELDLTRQLADTDMKIWSLNNPIGPTRELIDQIMESIQ